MKGQTKLHSKIYCIYYTMVSNFLLSFTISFIWLKEVEEKKTRWN